jgi:hypothetical protein
LILGKSIERPREPYGNKVLSRSIARKLFKLN